MMYSPYKLNNQGDNIQPWHTPFPNFDPVCCSMSSSNFCFLTCIQVSQEAGKVVWYSHLFKNFPQFGIVNETEVDVLLEFSCFFYDPVDVGNLISGSSAFLNPACTSGYSGLTYCWSNWKDFEQYFATMWNECSCAVIWTFFDISLIWYWNKKWPFPVPWPQPNFQNLLAYWMQYFDSFIF